MARRLLAMLAAALLAGPAAAMAAPSPAPPDSAVAARGIAAFGLDLFRQVGRTQPGNLVMSPYSASVALTMTSAGARARTALQMARVLRHDLPAARLRRAFGALQADLAAAGSGDVGRPLVRIANALWVQRGFAVRQAFLDALRGDFGAHAEELDFRDPDAARKAVNDWAARQTDGVIPEVLRPPQPDPGTALMLANAIYLKAEWARPFSHEATVPAPFTLADGTRVEVPTMHGIDLRSYARVGSVQAVQLGYRGGRLAMLALLPPKDGLAALERTLDEPRLRRIVGALRPTRLDLAMPKIHLHSSSLDLIPALKRLGMTDAFDPDRADLSGIAPITAGNRLVVNLVVQEADLAVDEKGTVAAAVTTVGVGPTSAPVAPLRLALERPFLLLIRDRRTGTPLFMARVADPR
ncbi:MAG: serpin [Miltoncostaeaceae bacterium]|nr:serpin [Miltoncostaeaceae bacterium]